MIILWHAEIMLLHIRGMVALFIGHEVLYLTVPTGTVCM